MNDPQANNNKNNSDDESADENNDSDDSAWWVDLYLTEFISINNFMCNVIEPAFSVFIFELLKSQLCPINFGLQWEWLHKYAIESVWMRLIVWSVMVHITLLFRCPFVVNVNNLLLVTAISTGFSPKSYLVRRPTQL